MRPGGAWGWFDAKHQIITWSVPTTLFWFTSLCTLLLFNALLG